ncbi:MAG: GMC family oxidoreductase [Verrucomicrobia bacterium]|nr:GMC family oxidoreductase [Verrucomicrobiota bacterium]
MTSTHHFDIIIIGTGAGGATLAHRLAPSGKKILLIERGSYLPREKENWQSQDVFLSSRYSVKEKWVDKKGKEFTPGTHYYVGGNTKFYGAALLRMREKDFGEVKHHGGVSPAWPLSYQDFEPYYTQAEKLYYVHGQRGIDSTEPPSPHPFPYPAVAHEPRIERLYKALEREGYHPFPLPLGIMLDEKRREKSPCIKCSTCDGFPCLVDAKADSHVVCVNEALKHPNVTLITDAYVERLETSPSGREVSQILVKRNGHNEIYKGNIVVVACGAINSAALLLRSASHKHPNGLANSSDCVGRFYMCHNNSAMIAITTEPNPTQFQKTMAINDFYYHAPDFDFPLGHIQMLGKADANMFKADAPVPAPRFILNNVAHHSIDFWLTTEDLPDPNNRVKLTKEGHIQLDYTENNTEGHLRLKKKLKHMLNHVGVRHRIIHNTAYFGKKIPIAGVAHQNGTVRFGKDPKTSALDVNCKAHDLDNLYVVDGGFFVSSSAVNPTLTIIANALRVGDHLLERMK